MRLIFTAMLAVSIGFLSAADKSHGLALYGPQDLKYKEGESYDFANLNAPKGGILNLDSFGSFTKLNPFSLKGRGHGWLGLCFQSLGQNSLDPDEPFSVYGQIAEYMELADDKSSITFYLRKVARFSDGHPLTADDVVFSFNIIQDPGFNPSSRMTYQDVESAKKVDDYTVTFIFKKFNKELPLIVSQLTILPKHIYGVEGKQFGKDYDEVKPVGSGAYMVEDFDKSSFITYKKVPNWWASDLPMNRGRYNFDKMKFHIFQDQKSVLTALKAGIVDAQQVSSSSDWHHEFSGPIFKKGYAIKKMFKTTNVMAIQGFVFNLRKPVFQDVRVRKAISCVMDFEAMNKQLFYGQYTRSKCYWDNKPEMMSRGPAAGAVRDELVRLFRKHNSPKDGKVFVRKEAIFRGPYTLGETLDGKMQSIGDRVLAANKYLDAAGWIFDPVDQVRKKDGVTLTFQFLLRGKGFQRICNPYIDKLKEIGVDAKIQICQPAEYSKREKAFDFDIITAHYGGNESPGNEQRFYLHSSSADTKGARNFMGLKNPAIDECIDKLIAAENREELILYTQVLDRILCANHYIVPQWYISSDRAIFWDRFSGPDKYAKTWFIGNLYNFWWLDEAKNTRLEVARKAKKSLK